MSFPMVALGEVLTPISRPESVNPEKEYRILGAHWYAEGLYVKDIKLGSEIQANKVYRVEKGDFVYNRLFAWKGSFAVATDENNGCYVSNEFPCFKVDTDCADGKYLWLYFSRAPIWEKALGLSTGGTPTSRNRLKEEKFLAMQIPLPPLPEQRRIVARIEELAARIEEARELRRGAEEEAKVLLVSKLNETLSINGKNNYQIVKIADVCDTTSGGTPSRHRFDFFENGTIPWIKSGELKDTIIKEAEEYITQEALDSSNAKIFPKGTLLVALYGANVGMIGILDIDAATNQAVCAVFPKKEFLERDYLFWFFRKMRPDYLKNSFGGAQPNISQKMIRETEIPIPPLSEQRRIVTYLNSLKAEVDALRRLQAETSAELDVLMPAVLDRAFKEEL